MKNFKMYAPCLFGVEGVLADELRRMGAADVTAENGCVRFTGDHLVLANANLKLRTAERVLIEVGSFTATTFTELFDRVLALPWADYIGRTDTFPVTGYSISSKLHSVPDCQSIIKKAVVERLKSVYKTAWFEENGPTKKIRFSCQKNRFILGIDASGVGLHKRGYRENSTIAPIKETLAAAMCYLAGIYPDTQLYDPFCGSGTLLIEAAMIAKNIAPGLRRTFAAERFGDLFEKAFQTARSDCLSAIRPKVEFHAFGSDLLPEAVALTLKNARLAGVAELVTAQVADMADFQLPNGRFAVLTNPPYGERLLDIRGAEQLYRQMGKKFLPGRGRKYFIISSDDDFEKCFGRPADKRRKLYNGMLKCQLYMYFKNLNLQ